MTKDEDEKAKDIKKIIMVNETNYIAGCQSTILELFLSLIVVYLRLLTEVVSQRIKK